MIAAAPNPRPTGVVLISSVDAAEGVAQHKVVPARGALNQKAPCSAPPSGCTNEGLDREVFSRASSWTFATLAPHLTKIPILMVACNDPYAPK